MSEQPQQPAGRGQPEPPATDLDDGDIPDYDLVEQGTNAALHAVVREVGAAVGSGELDRREAVVLLSDKVAGLAAADPGVTDQSVRSRVVEELDPVFEAAGYQRLSPFEF